MPRGDSEQLPRCKVCWRSRRVAVLCVGSTTTSTWASFRTRLGTPRLSTPGSYSEVICNPKTATEHQLRTHLKEPDLAKHPPQLFVLYYAGHGILEHGKMWLVPAHANIRDPDDDLQRECLSLNDLLEMLRKHLDQPVQN